MRILFPCIEGKITGPERWRIDLVAELSKTHEVYCVPTNNFSLFTKFFKVFKTDIIHSYNQEIGTLLFIIIGKLIGKRIIHTAHGDFYSELQNKKGLKKLLWIPVNKFQLFVSQFITFPSEFTKKITTKNYPNIMNKCSVVYNGINKMALKSVHKTKKRSLGIDKETLVLIEVTNFNHHEKARGITTLVNEYKKFVRLSGIKSTLLIVGNGFLVNKYRQEYESENIKFLGYRKDVISLIKMADVFVHYSYLDNLPMVVLEALTCNKYVICNRVGGVSEIHNKKLMITNDFSKLLLLFSNNKLDDRKSGKKFEKFYIENVVNQFVHVYNLSV